jgi:hypothetical protein
MKQKQAARQTDTHPGESADQVADLTGDSPWLWLAGFAAAALVALCAIEDHYDGRQQQIERRYQYRVEQLALRPVDTEVDEISRNSPAEPLVSLAPIRWLLLVVLLIASTGLLNEVANRR